MVFFLPLDCDIQTFRCRDQCPVMPNHTFYDGLHTSNIHFLDHQNHPISHFLCVQLLVSAFRLHRTLCTSLATDQLPFLGSLHLFLTLKLFPFLVSIHFLQNLPFELSQSVITVLQKDSLFPRELLRHLEKYMTHMTYRSQEEHLYQRLLLTLHNFPNVVAEYPYTHIGSYLNRNHPILFLWHQRP